MEVSYTLWGLQHQREVKVVLTRGTHLHDSVCVLYKANSGWSTLYLASQRSRVPSEICCLFGSIVLKFINQRRPAEMPRIGRWCTRFDSFLLVSLIAFVS